MKKIFYHMVSTTLLFPIVAQAQGWTGWQDVQKNMAPGLPASKTVDIVANFMQWILGVFGFIGIIGFVVAGIWYLTAAGDETQIERAKKAMMYSIIGVIVGLMGLLILQAVDKWLKGSAGF
ncbi:MAG TPA: hypothetical protein VJH89_02315 [Patescibacteria group bacterium]|nr:hypothetical protein [Patescibacteria group bacterium]